ncbi:GGDEF domain-containing protein [Catenovulum sediminis]|uniref:GGDEF domain-containing protein n=1 Tax=Catenovulum sediminis TaxID=1740262 RepID=UPI00117D2129|nr:GGDEF domain-containing protein [Catenovulum sediminis]
MTYKKRLALISSELTRNNNGRIFRSLQKLANQKGVALIVYEGRTLGAKQYAQAQRNFVYQFPQKGMIDFLVATSAAVPRAYPRDKFEALFLDKLDCPTVVYYNERPGCHSVQIDSASASAEMVKHLIEKHQYSRFAVLKGPETEPEAQKRAAATLNTLAAYGLAKNTLVEQADWSADGAIRFIKKVIAESRNIEAIIFPNDETAIAALDYINHFAQDKIGKYAVVGFDNALNARLINPQLTTAEHPHEAMAEYVVDTLLNNAAMPKFKLFPAPIKYRQSCGCNNQFQPAGTDNRLFTQEFNIYENVQAFDYQDYFVKLTTALVNRGIRGCFISLYQNEPFQLQEDTQLPQNAKLVYAFDAGKRVAIEEGNIFPTRDLIPKTLFKLDDYACLVVNNLYFADRHFGFVVFDLSVGRVQDAQDICANIASTLNTVQIFNNFENAVDRNQHLLKRLTERNEQLSHYNQTLKELSNLDEMTGLLNRRGLHESFNNLQKESGSNEFTIFYADLDDLKQINDKLSHAKGDEAICLAAECLTSLFRKSDVIARVGGDEFIVCTAMNQTQAKQVANRLESRLFKINQQEKLDFKLGISIGFYTFKQHKLVNIEHAITEADKALYLEKRAKKSLPPTD